GIRNRRRIAPSETIVEEDITSMTDVSTRDEPNNETKPFIQYLIPTHDTTGIDRVNEINKQSEDTLSTDTHSLTLHNESDLPNGTVEV
ncbi:unnamed protein product, partial [Rotaria sp. Silwood1]